IRIHLDLTLLLVHTLFPTRFPPSDPSAQDAAAWCYINCDSCVASEELNVEKKVKEVCAQLKVKVHTCWGSTLYHMEDLPFHQISRLPDVYTEFRKAVESQSRVRPVLPTPERLNPLPPGLDEGAIPTAEDLQQT
ncbi:hypothetical protein XENOCAPTIV_007582, partial [Xenoophorus captivus]